MLTLQQRCKKVNKGTLIQLGMAHKVTVYSNWVKTTEHEFETLEEAREFAEEMKNQQYVTIIDEIEEEG